MTLPEAHDYCMRSAWKHAPNNAYFKKGNLAISKSRIEFRPCISLNSYQMKNVKFLENDSICLINDNIALKISDDK